jgi:hypothetical protein
MTDDEARQYVARWKQAGPALEKVRREELRMLSDDDVRSQIHALLEIAGYVPQNRPTSGLVEQQRIFMKARS